MKCPQPEATYHKRSQKVMEVIKSTTALIYHTKAHANCMCLTLIVQRLPHQQSPNCHASCLDVNSGHI